MSSKVYQFKGDAPRERSLADFRWVEIGYDARFIGLGQKVKTWGQSWSQSSTWEVVEIDIAAGKLKLKRS